MFLHFLCTQLGKTIQELESSISITELTKWQVYFNQEHWKNRIMQETKEGKSAALMALFLGKNG